MIIRKIPLREILLSYEANRDRAIENEIKQTNNPTTPETTRRDNVDVNEILTLLSGNTGPAPDKPITAPGQVLNFKGGEMKIKNKSGGK
jgi:hypothetical protein